MKLLSSDIDEIISARLDWENLSGKSIAITGATGMLATYIVESLVAISKRLPIPLEIIALVRNPEKAQDLFSHHKGNRHFHIAKWSPEDRTLPFTDLDILIHAASIPRPDSCHPVDVIEPNVIGTWNLLQFIKNHCRHFNQFIFLSSGAIYGNKQKSDATILEDTLPLINPILPQSCYAESKCAGENICISFMHQYGIPVKIVRYAHTFGTNIDLNSDPRSFAVFVKSVISGKDINLLTDGLATRHFCYATDATVALFTILLKGMAGEAYNIANPDNASTIRDLAQMLIDLMPENKLKVTYDREQPPSGYSPLKEGACLDIGKLKNLGWQPLVSLKDGFSRVLKANS